jgi:Kelch motif
MRTIAGSWVVAAGLLSASPLLVALPLPFTLQLLAQPAPVGAWTPVGTWSFKASRPATTNEAAAVAIGGKLYAPGGSDKGKSVTRLDEYDPATDRWRALADLPQPLDHLAVEALNGKLYAFGGFASVIHAGASDASAVTVGKEFKGSFI